MNFKAFYSKWRFYEGNEGYLRGKKGSKTVPNKPLVRKNRDPWSNQNLNLPMGENVAVLYSHNKKIYDLLVICLYFL